MAKEMKGSAEFLIRNANRCDISEVKRIADTNRKTIGFVVRPIFENSMISNELLVAVTDGKILGFVRWHKRQNGWSVVYEICVDGAFRGYGIGKKLINRIPKPVRLKCPLDNESNGFYEHIGFKLISREKGRKRFLNVWSDGLAMNYFKVVREDLTSVGLLGAARLQYEVGEWVYPLEPLSDHPRKGGGLWVLHRRCDARAFRRYVKIKHGFDTRIFTCLIGRIIPIKSNSTYRIKTDKVMLLEELWK